MKDGSNYAVLEADDDDGPAFTVTKNGKSKLRLRVSGGAKPLKIKGSKAYEKGVPNNMVIEWINALYKDCTGKGSE